MGMKLSGIAAAESIDTSAEKISIEGLDISSLEEGKGLFNYEHKNAKTEGSSPQDLLGAITFAKKIFSAKDCDNDRQRRFWDSVELPFVYIEGELFDDEEPGHDAAKAMATVINFYKKRELPIVARFSIDGSTLERDDKDHNLLKRAIARHVAITIQPCNHSCISDVIEPKTTLEKRTDVDDPARFSHSGLYRLPGVEFKVELIDQDLEKTEEDLEKALSAGVPNAAPSQLAQGAALQVSDVSGDKKQLISKVKGAIRDWDRKKSLKTHLEKAVPEATQGFVDKFCELVDHFRLKKTAELHERLESITKGLTGQALEDAIAKLPWIGGSNEDLRRDPNTPETQVGGVKTKIEGVPKAPVGTGTQVGIASPHTAVTNFMARFTPSTQAPKSWAETKPKFDVEGQKKKLQEHGWTMQSTPHGWSAMPPQAPMAKSDGNVTFFHPHTASLHLPGKVFKFHADASEPIHETASAPLVKLFHDRAMSGWKQLNSALREGKLPDSVIRLAASVSQSPLEVPSHLRDWIGDLAGLDGVNNDPAKDRAFNALKTAVECFGPEGRSYMDANTQQPFAVSTPNAQYALQILGVGNVIPHDDNLIKDVFRLADDESLGAVKKAISVNPTVWDDVVRFYGDEHAAMKHVLQGGNQEHLKQFPEDALIHGATLHFLCSPKDSEAQSLIESLGKGEDTYGKMFDRWCRKYGPQMAVLLYYVYLAPKMLAQNTQQG